jgi:hypothetical protein
MDILWPVFVSGTHEGVRNRSCYRASAGPVSFTGVTTSDVLSLAADYPIIMG